MVVVEVSAAAALPVGWFIKVVIDYLPVHIPLQLALVEVAQLTGIPTLKVKEIPQSLEH